MILTIFEGNDIRDAFEYYNYRKLVERSGAENSSIPCLPGSKLCHLYRGLQESSLGTRSYVFNFALNSIRQAKNNLEQSLGPSKDTDATQKFKNFQFTLKSPTGVIPFNPGNVNADEPAYADKVRSGEISFDIYSEALRNFSDLSKRHKFKGVVLYLPSAYTAYQSYVNFSDPQINELMNQFSQEQRKFFKENVKSLGYLFFDATDHLQELASAYREPDKLLYFPSNLHLTSLGHKVVADYLNQELRPFLKRKS